MGRPRRGSARRRSVWRSPPCPTSVRGRTAVCLTLSEILVAVLFGPGRPVFPCLPSHPPRSLSPWRNWAPSTRTTRPPVRPPPARAGCVRGHWGIENSSHHVRDVVFAEDASTVHAGSAPRAMAVFAESGHRPAAAAGSGQHRRDHPGDPGHTRTRPLDLGASPSAHSYRELEAPCTRQSCTKTRWAPTGGPPLRRTSCSARVPRTTTTSAYTQPRAPPVQSSSTAQKERAAPPTCGGRTTADRRPRRGAHAVRVRLLTSRHSTGDGARCPRTTHGRATRFRVPEWWCRTATAGPSQRFAGTGGGPISRCQLVAGNRPARRKRAVRRGHLPEPSHAEGTGDDLPWRRHACAPAPWDDHDAVVGLQAARVVASRNRESRSQALRRAIRP